VPPQNFLHPHPHIEAVVSHIEREKWVQLTIQECEYVGDTDQAFYADLQKLQPTDMEEEPTEI
jgi:hypothetical protein